MVCAPESIEFRLAEFSRLHLSAALESSADFVTPPTAGCTPLVRKLPLGGEERQWPSRASWGDRTSAWR